MMPRAFQATLHCQRILVEVPGDSPIVGFHTVRSTLAFSESRARQRLVAALRMEPRFRALVGARSDDCVIEVEDLVEISLGTWGCRWRRVGFALYQGGNDG